MLVPGSLMLLFHWIREVLWPVLWVSWLHPKIALLHSPPVFLLLNPRIRLRSSPLIFLLLAPIIAPRVSLCFLNPGIGLWFAPGFLLLWFAPWSPRICWFLLRSCVPWVVFGLSPRVLDLLVPSAELRLASGLLRAWAPRVELWLRSGWAKHVVLGQGEGTPVFKRWGNASDKHKCKSFHLIVLFYKLRTSITLAAFKNFISNEIFNCLRTTTVDSMHMKIILN